MESTLKRPSGSVILQNVVVKIFPDVTEAAKAYHRQMDNISSAVKPLLLKGNALVMEPGEPRSVTLADVQPMLEALWMTKTGSFSEATLDEYITYVLRDEALPSRFKDHVMLYNEASIGRPNVLQVHGDLTADNILWTKDGFRLIDFSVRREVAYWQADTAKFKFHQFRNFGLVPELNDVERFFFYCHFCRVWTRDVGARLALEALFNDYLQEIGELA